MSSSSTDDDGSSKESTTVETPQIHRTTKLRRKKAREKMQLRLLKARLGPTLSAAVDVFQRQDVNQVLANSTSHADEACMSNVSVEGVVRSCSSDTEPAQEPEWSCAGQNSPSSENKNNVPAEEGGNLQRLSTSDESSMDLDDCSTEVQRLEYQALGDGGPPGDGDPDDPDDHDNNDEYDSDQSEGNNYWDALQDDNHERDENNVIDSENSEPSDPEDSDPSDPESEGDDDEGGNRNLSFNPGRLNAICHLYAQNSVKEVLAIVLALFDRHSWTYESLLGCLNLLNTTLGGNYFPKSKKPLWKALNRKGLGMKKHAYCKRCKRSLGRYKHLRRRVQCPNATCRQIFLKKVTPYFMELDLKAQLSQFLARPDAADLLFSKANRVKHNDDALEDIYDGSEYKRLQDANVLGENDFSYTFNNDGFNPTKTSSIQVNPVYVRLNELPINVRQKHLFLAGVWVDRGDPELVLYLQQCLIRQGNRLSRHGITWNVPGRGLITSKFIPTCCTVDAKARCIIMNMMGPTGYYGCTFCPIQGVQANGVKFPLQDNMPHPRNHAQLVALMEAAHENPDGNHEGVLGISALKFLHHFNLGTGMSTDDLHPLYEGVVLFHTDKLLSDNWAGYYIGAPGNIALINARLLSMKPPTLLSRTPRGIDTRAKWRGHEWRNWILYYAYTCLTGLLPQRYLRHLMKLSRAIFLVSRDSMTPEDLQEAEDLFTEYVRDFQQFFGVECMRFNVHMLLHVVPAVRCWGPVFVHSTFNFESWNLKLKKHVKSMKDPILQIVNRHLISSFIASVPFDPVNFSPSVQLEVASILTKSDLKTAVKVGDVYLLGPGEPGIVSEEERLALETVDVRNIVGLTRFQRALYKRLEIRSTEYTRNGKNNNSHVLSWNGTFLRVKSIAKVARVNEPDIWVLFANELQLNGRVNIISHFASVAPVQQHQHLQVCFFETVRAFAIHMECAGLSVIAPMPNSCEID